MQTEDVAQYEADYYRMPDLAADNGYQLVVDQDLLMAEADEGGVGYAIEGAPEANPFYTWVMFLRGGEFAEIKSLMKFTFETAARKQSGSMVSMNSFLNWRKVRQELQQVITCAQSMGGALTRGTSCSSYTAAPPM